jgi:large subunit ribosomal protein L15
VSPNIVSKIHSRSKNKLTIARATVAGAQSSAQNNFMQLNTLKPRHANYRSTVVGRGGKRGKTSGRGGKGQTARAGHKIRPEMRDLIKKLPKLRGHGINRARTVRRDRVTMRPSTSPRLKPRSKRRDYLALDSPREGPRERRKGPLAAIKILGTGELTKSFVIKNCRSLPLPKLLSKAGGSLNA